MKKKPIIDPLSSEMQELLGKPRTATPTLVNATTTAPTLNPTTSPTDTQATTDPLARYTDALSRLPDSQQERYKDKLPGFTTTPFPDWIPQNIEDLSQTAVQYDRNFYRLSDQDFAQRHPGLAMGNRDLARMLAKDMGGGNARLSPAVRDAFLTTGLEGALGAFGDTPGTIRSGSAAEAAIGRSLAGPEGILGFQDANRRRALESAQIASALFPHRQIGFSGEAAVQIAAGNIDMENTYNFSKKAYDTGLDLFNWQINAGNINQAIEQRNLAAKAIADRANAGATTDAAAKAARAQKIAAGAAVAATIIGAIIVT